MTYVDWEFKGESFGNCVCDYGCPCQFNALPTHGVCEAAVGFNITEGHFGDVTLDGLRSVLIASWPGPVHEGNGQMQIIIDTRADDRQREAIYKIMTGEETEPGATMFQIYTSMCTTIHETLYRRIDLEIDIEERTGRIIVEGEVETYGEPIRNPVTGTPTRLRIEKDQGFEFLSAEMGSGRTRTMGAIQLEFENSYGQFNYLHLSPTGIVQ